MTSPDGEGLTLVSTAPVGKGVTYWLNRNGEAHKLVTDYDRKRKYLDGKRIPWSRDPWTEDVK